MFTPQNVIVMNNKFTVNDYSLTSDLNEAVIKVASLL